jgi:WD40 repeat protein
MSSIHAASLAEVRVPENPFPGLRPFELNESHLFFGRDGQVEKLIGKLARSHFLAVVGASGSGKSSLVRAGLLPALLSGLMGGTSSNWRMAVLRPGHDPLASLAAALNSSRPDDQESQQDAAINVAMTEATLRRGSRGLIEAARQSGISSNENLLVLVDQFEEVFRVARSGTGRVYEDETATFVKLLLEAARQREVSIYVALTMRSDYLGDCARFFDLPEAINESQYLVPRLTRQELQQVITGPIAVCGGRIAPRLLSRLLNDMGDDQDQLPVLQHVLMRMWEKSKEDRREEAATPIDLSDYEATGGMADALSQHADEALNSLPASLHPIAETLFKALTEKGEDNREVRRPTLLAKLGEVTSASSNELKKIIEAFREPGRSFLMPPVPVRLKDDSLIDISHESLIRRWSALKKWVEEESESAKIYVRLAETAELHERGKAALWQNPDLQYALEWREQHQPNAAWAARYHPGFAGAMDFLEFSRQNEEEAQRKHEQVKQAKAQAEAAELRATVETKAAEQARRSAIRLRRLTVVLAVFVVIAIAAAWFALGQQRLAHQEQLISQSRALAAQAEQTLTQDQPLALALALRGWHISRTVEASLAVTDSFPQVVATLEGHTGLVRSAVFSPDSDFIITASDDKKVGVWDADSGESLGILQGHTDRVWSAVFSPNKKRILTASDDKTARIWNASNGHLLVTLRGHTAGVDSAVYSPDGQRILTASFDGTARVWNADSGQLLATLQAHTGRLGFVQQLLAMLPDHSGPVYSAVFSPDGQDILTASRDQTARIWNATNGQLLATLQGHAGPVYSAIFSPDGQRILTASADGTARVWNASSGQLSVALRGHAGPVYSAIFSPDGQRILTASDDGTARVWNASSGQLFAALRGHTGPVGRAIFSPDGQRIVTASADQTACVWQVTESGQLLATLQGHTETVYRAAFSPDGQRIVTASADHTARVWSTISGQPMATLQGHTAPVYSAVFSPDGQHIATASGDHTARVWNAISGQPMATLQGHTGPVYGVVFSPDGQHIATASGDHTARVWNAISGQPMATLQGHSARVSSVEFSPDGRRILTASADKTARVWSADSGQLLATLTGHTSFINSAAFSPDGQRILTASTDQTARVWNAGSGQLLGILQGHTGSVRSAAYSPDGQRIVTVSADYTARVWDAKTRQLVLTLQGHTEPVVSVVFSPDGRRILTAARDGTGRVWNAGNGQLLAILFSHSNTVWTTDRQLVADLHGPTESVVRAVFSPDGQRILTASDDKTARVFRLVTISEIAELLAK